MRSKTDRLFQRSGFFRKTEYAIKIVLSLIIHPFLNPRNKYGEYWIFGEGDDRFENNGRVFFSFMKKNHPEIRLFWVCEKESIERLSHYICIDNLVSRRSVKNYLLALSADVVIYGFSDRDCAPGLFRIIRNRHALIVNINHGFDGIKGMPIDYYSQLPVDIICAASTYEKKFKVEKCGADISKVCVTGFPRYDEFMVNDKGNAIRKILIMPTWRDWYEYESGYSQFEMTPLYEAYAHALIALNELAFEQQLTISFAFHPRMKLLFKNANWESLSNIKNVENSTSFSNIIKEADLLISDYSSLFWDYIYMNKPVILYWFDEDVYRKRRGLLVDSSFYKYICRTPSELICVLKSILSNNEKMNNMFWDFFDWHDRCNSQRLYSEIINHLK